MHGNGLDGNGLEVPCHHFKGKDKNITRLEQLLKKS